MAHFIFPFTLPLLTILLLTFSANGTFWRLTKPGPIKLGTEKLSHFQFYWHDTQNGSNPTSINIVKRPPNNVSLTTGFGIVNMIDDPLTERPNIESRMLGRAQGLYGQASQKEIGLLMAMNFVFTTGRYNGSTLTVLGRNQVAQKVREMPVIGGTGLFRFARGYVQASTYNLDMPAGNAIAYGFNRVYLVLWYKMPKWDIVLGIEGLEPGSLEKDRIFIIWRARKPNNEPLLAHITSFSMLQLWV